MKESKFCTIGDVQELRKVKDLLKPLKASEKILTDKVKNSFEIGTHCVGGVPFKISQTTTRSYDAGNVRLNFRRNLKKLFDAGVFQVIPSKFEEFAAANGYDIGALMELTHSSRLSM